MVNNSFENIGMKSNTTQSSRKLPTDNTATPQMSQRSNYCFLYFISFLFKETLSYKSGCFNDRRLNEEVI